MKYYETEMYKIISKEFDSRMEMAVISYIIEKGWKNVKQITEEEILCIEGNGLMTAEFLQALVRCARRICTELNFYDDFLVYIKKYLFVKGCNQKHITLYHYEYDNAEWEDVCDQLEVEDALYTDIDMVEVNVIIEKVLVRGENDE